MYFKTYTNVKKLHKFKQEMYEKCNVQQDIGIRRLRLDFVICKESRKALSRGMPCLCMA